MQRSGFKFSAKLIETKPHLYFGAVKAAVLQELSELIKRYNLSKVKTDTLLALIDKVDALTYLKDKNISVSISAVSDLLLPLMENATAVDKLEFKHLQKIIDDYSVLLYFHHFLF